MSDLLVGYFVADKTKNNFTVANHGLLNGDTVRFALGAVGNALPSPLVEGTWYYVVNATQDAFQVSETQGGAVFDITNSGTGNNEAWSPEPTALVWHYELLTSKNDNTFLPELNEVNYYAQRGWQLLQSGQQTWESEGTSTYWYLMGKQEPPSL